VTAAGTDRARGVPPRIAPALAACADGSLPPNVALMRLIGEAASEEEARRALATALSTMDATGRTAEAERLRRLQALWRASPGAWEVVRSVLADADHSAAAEGGVAAIARWAAIFDRLAERAPEAAVALYSLGRPDLLDAATQELVGLLRSWCLLGPERHVLDLGCGIGRLAAALAEHVGSVTGIDVSAAMIAAARNRSAGLANVRLMQTEGRDLAVFADESFDLVLAVDVFPYLVHAGSGVAERHVADAARLLRPGGALAIFNFSYRGDPAADGAEVARLAQRNGLWPARSGARPLSLWDGVAYLLMKRARLRENTLRAPARNRKIDIVRPQ
jgi:ubiquinone/menaquinone biosynthesis C-methylase UbiE